MSIWQRTITLVVNIQAENLHWILISKHESSKLKLVEFSNKRKTINDFLYLLLYRYQ